MRSIITTLINLGLIFLASNFALCVVGCGAFKDVTSAVSDGVTAAIKDAPAPNPWSTYGPVAGIAGLLAYAMGSFGKGWIRGKLAKYDGKNNRDPG